MASQTIEKQISRLDIFPNHYQVLSRQRGIKRALFTALPFIPRHIYFPLLYELKTSFRRLISFNKTSFNRHKSDQNLLVNVGCGQTGKPGWVNVDIDQFPGVNCVYDCRKCLPFTDGSVKGIFTEHFFEHLDYTEEAPYFLSHCYRVLKSGGVLRIIVPDAEKYLRAYCEDGWEKLSQIRPLDSDRSDFYFGSQYNTKMELVNVVFRQYFDHKFAYDYATLEFLLYKYGFSAVYRQDFGRSRMNELTIDQAIRASESLYVEAVK